MDRFGLFMFEAATAVGAGVGVVVRLIQLTVEESCGRRFSRRVGWPAVGLWALGFALAAFAAASVLSIGILVLPVAVVACGVVAWRSRALPEGALGAGLGTGIVLGVIGLMNPTRVPCGAIAVSRIQRGTVSCGGVDGTSWLPAAFAMIVVALAGQIMLARQGREGRNTAP